MNLRRILQTTPVDELVWTLVDIMTPALRIRLARYVLETWPRRECESCQASMSPREKRFRCRRCRRLCCSKCRTSFGPREDRTWYCLACLPRHMRAQRLAACLERRRGLRLVEEPGATGARDHEGEAVPETPAADPLT